MGKLRKIAIGFGVIFLVIVLLGVAAVASNNLTEYDLKNPKLTKEEIVSQSLENISVQKLIDDNYMYADSIVHMKGEIIQIWHMYGDVYQLNIRVEGQEDGQADGILLKYASDTEPKAFSNIDFYGSVQEVEERPNLLTGQTMYLVNIDALLVDYSK